MTTPGLSNRRGERILLFCVLALALWLRTRDIQSLQVCPDDGSYLHSAQIDVIEPGLNPVTWVQEDSAWVRWLSAHYAEENVTYQHSYAHQYVTRFLFRLGLDSVTALRTSTALTGVLTAFFAWWLFAAAWPSHRRVGLLAAAFVAVAPVHVFYSRTGWGQVGFACFYLAYSVVLYRVLFVIQSDDRRALRRAGWALMAFSLLAFGWQEGVAPYIVGSGFLVLLASFFRAEGDTRPWIQRLCSRRTWTYVWSAIPIGAATLALKLFSPFAQKYWFDKQYPSGIETWAQLKRASLGNMASGQRFDLQFGWLTAALALFGILVCFRRAPRLAFHLVASASIGAVLLFSFFADGYLFRIYMPVFVIGLVFAAIGLAALAEWIAARAGHAAGAIAVAAVIVLLVLTTWITLFGRVESTLFVERLYAQTSQGNVDCRAVDLPILARMRAEWRPGERVGVFGDKAAIYRLQDIGIRAQEDYLEGPAESWPTWIVAVTRIFEQRPFTIAHGGQYTLVVSDTVNRWSLYKREAH